jgi:hypothetical protein
MKSKAVAAALLAAFVMPAHAQPLKGGAIAASQIDAVLTVLAVDQKARTVTVRGPKGGTPDAIVAEEVRLAPKGGTPGGVVVRTQQLAGVVDAVDYTDRYIALRGPKGNTLSLKVADGVKLEGLSAGDRVAVTHTEALAMEMIPQAPAKKPAAKKS